MSAPGSVRPKIEKGLVVYNVAGPAAPLIVPPYYGPFVAPEPPYVPTARRWEVVMVNPFQAWMTCIDGPGATIAERGLFWENWSPDARSALQRFVTLADEQAQRLAAHAETWRAARVAAAEILAGGPVPGAPPAATAAAGLLAGTPQVSARLAALEEDMRMVKDAIRIAIKNARKPGAERE